MRRNKVRTLFSACQSVPHSGLGTQVGAQQCAEGLPVSEEGTKPRGARSWSRAWPRLWCRHDGLTTATVSRTPGGDSAKEAFSYLAIFNVGTGATQCPDACMMP
ncbi:hypothetical protein LIA77_02944 [Sarocladium implicatum]|nr:hypothetical protein LIA77_02944 [Sarocladium implicatum]